MADEYIEIRPDVQRGEPVIRGTRVTAYTIAEIANRGTPVHEILRHYPSLTVEQIEAARDFARAHPRALTPIKPQGRVVFEILAKDLDEKT
jgi:uncharacterized protein (DUF433 family)